FGFGVDRGLKIVGDLHVLAASVGLVPAAASPGRLDLLQPVFCHPALLAEARDVVDVDPAPDAFSPARRVALQIAPVVEALADGVYPAPAERDVDRLLRRDRLQAGADLVDPDPDLALAVVV